MFRVDIIMMNKYWTENINESLFVLKSSLRVTGITLKNHGGYLNVFDKYDLIPTRLRDF